jgi:adenylate cyclase
MSLSRRDRRDWRIILWVSIISALLSAAFGYVIMPEGVSRGVSMLLGVASSLAIATPIAFFETRSARVESLRRLQRLPLSVYFAIKVAVYFVIIVGGLLFVRYVVLSTLGQHPALDSAFRDSLLFAVGMSVSANLLFELGGLLGFATLRSLVTGRYVQPKAEQKTFLLIDMKDSTGMAERLGPIRFHELLNDFFRDVSDAALECEAEIHKYVGDEAILTWSGARGLADSECLECPFIARDFMQANRERYLGHYGTVPEFRAALHCGEIVAGEIGDVRREIAYVGDTLNVAARLLDAAKTSGRDVLVSSELLERASLPASLKAEKLPVLNVRGRAAPLAIAALERIV